MAGQPAPVYLLYGEEALLRDRRANEIVARLLEPDSVAYNRDAFVGPDVDLSRVVAACETLPVFAERRVVLVRNLDLKAAAASAELVAYLRRPNPRTVLVLTAGAAPAPGKSKPQAEGPGRKTSRALGVKDFMALIPAREEFAPLRADQALEFARNAARTRGVEIDADAARLLRELVGVDAARIEDEIEKAALYLGARNRIESEDIAALVRQTRTHTMFELTDAIAEGDRAAVLRHLDALLADGNEPFGLVGMVGWQLRRTLRGAAAADAGAAPAEIARTAGVHYRLQERFAHGARRLGARRAAAALCALSALDRELKSSAGDARIALERTLLELLGPAARPAR